jgi:adenine deaminase
MGRLTALSFSLAYFSLGASALGQSGDTLVLLHANVIDGLGGAPLSDRAVVVRDGRIADIVTSSAAPQVGAVQDLRGKYLLPGTEHGRLGIFRRRAP